MTGSRRGVSKETSRLAAFLREHGHHIITAWERQARALPSATGIPQLQLIDSIPELLEAFADQVERTAEGEPPGIRKQTGDQHALDRLRDGFDLIEVVAELSLLRDNILQTWEETNGSPRAERAEERAVNQMIDQILMASIARYTETRDRVLRVLDRVSATAEQARTLDELLQQLASTFHDEVPSVDSVAILLNEDDVLTLRAANGLEHETSGGLSVRVGDGFLGTMAAEKKPMQLTEAASDSLVRSDTIRLHGTKALFGVPLVDRGELIGVAQMSSQVVRDFSQQDRVLFTSMAGRATLAVSQHRLLDRAEREVALRDQILAIVSHDLRNPISTIDLSATMIARHKNIQDDGKTLSQIDVIRRNAARAGRLIDDLLDVSGIQAGQLSLKLGIHELTSILQESVRSHEPTARQAKIDFRRDLNVDHYCVCCDRDRLLQVLANLIGNPLKFCREGDKVTLSARVSGHEALLSVADTGPGIVADELDHIFDLYWRGRPREGGTGLGLFVAKGIIASHGGRIWVDSEVGVGSTFSCR